MEKGREEKKKLGEGPQISRMEAVTHGAYGGGLYGTEKGETEEQVKKKAPASDTQSADGPVERHADRHLSHPPPPSSGDKDTDITGQAYIQ